MAKDGGGEAAPFVPSKEWLDSYLGQATPELMTFATRYARARARKPKLVRDVDDSYARELVADIIGDTLLGVIVWDPDRVSLKKHVLDAIKSRARHDFVHALNFRPVRLDDRRVLTEVEGALADSAPPGDLVSSASGAILDALRELARDDDDVSLMLSAFSELVTKKRDVMKLTGLTHKRYDAARKRLSRLTLQLPASLRQAVLERE